MTTASNPLHALLRSVQDTMDRFKDAVGLPRSVSVLGVMRACPILVFLGVLALAAIAVITLS